MHDWPIFLFPLVASLAWVVVYGVSAYAILAIPRLEDVVSGVGEATLPSLTVIIAARDEAEAIRDGVLSLLGQDYPKLNLVVVDDRSSDGTGVILDEIATADDRLTVIHNRFLPEGWLGKVNALKLATERAAGEWILYTDADVCFERGLLAKAVRHAENERCDHLALIPELVTRSFLMEAVIRAFGLAFLLQTRAHLINKDRSSGVIGVGAFNLVRRSFFERTEGFEWLRMEIGDDLALGTLLKNNGSKSRVAFALDGFRVVWHPSLKSLFAALERIGHYRLPKMCLLCVLTWLFVAAPVATPFMTSSPWTLSAIAAVGAFLLYCVVWSARFRLPLLPSLAIPIGQVVLTVMILRALVKARWRGTIKWRGTEYAIDELRENQRVFL